MWFVFIIESLGLVVVCPYYSHPLQKLVVSTAAQYTKHWFPAAPSAGGWPTGGWTHVADPGPMS